MKVNLNFSGFNISAKGMSIQRKKMDLIAENIANVDTTKTAEGTTYQRKYLVVNGEKQVNAPASFQNELRLKTTDPEHIFKEIEIKPDAIDGKVVNIQENKDTEPGNMVYMPDHPDADEKGYVMMPNVNIVTEMVDMIAATRSYESNMTAFNAAKQVAKDSLEI